MTITLEMPDDLLTVLLARARAEGRPAADLAASLLAECFAEDTAAVQEGLDTLAAGRVRPVQDYISEQRARHGCHDTWPVSAAA